MIWSMLLACQTEVSSKPNTDEPSEPTAEALPEVELDGVDSAEPDPPEIPTGRQLKRMTIPQVRDSMVQITGHAWDGGRESKWDEYAETLGVADYQLRVESDRSPSVMFQKFLDDAATETCLLWANDQEGTFFRLGTSDDLGRDNVRGLIVDLRFQVQGKSRLVEDPIIDDYELLFQTAHQRTQDPILAWQTVCIALFTHPDFFMY